MNKITLKNVAQYFTLNKSLFIVILTIFIVTSCSPATASPTNSHGESENWPIPVEIHEGTGPDVIVLPTSWLPAEMVLISRGGTLISFVHFLGESLQSRNLLTTTSILGKEMRFSLSHDEMMIVDIDVESEDEWILQVYSLSPSFLLSPGMMIDGSGNQIILFPDEIPTRFNIIWNGEGSISVKALNGGERRIQVMASTTTIDDSFTLPEGTRAIEVYAVDEWTLRFLE